MATFLHGSNGIIVPRGLFYESKLNQTLGGSDPRSSNPALTRMTVHANQFAISGTLTLDAYLNARPVQQVLSGNVTLEEAQWFVDQLRLNRTGKTTAFLLDVTDEFYTMGFVGAVIALSPNATVDNSVNHTPTQPPAPWWEQLFNVIVSVAAIAWNAAVAVANFMINLVKWLVNIVVGLVIGLATGDWTYFVDNVVKPFVEAMMALIKFIVDLVKAVVDIILAPINNAIKGFVTDLLNIVFMHTLHTNLPLAARLLVDMIEASALAAAIIILLLVLKGLELVIRLFLGLVSFLSGLIIQLLMSAIVGAAIGAAVAALISSLESGDTAGAILAGIGLTLGALDLAVLLFSSFKKLSGSKAMKTAGGWDVVLAIFGVIASVATDGVIKAWTAPDHDKKAATIVTDAIGLAFTLGAVGLWLDERNNADTGKFSRYWPITYYVSTAIVFASLGVSVAALVWDTVGS